MSRKAEGKLLQKQGEFFLRLAELSFVGGLLGSFVAFVLERKIGVGGFLLSILVALIAIVVSYRWGSKLYRRGVEQQEEDR